MSYFVFSIPYFVIATDTNLANGRPAEAWTGHPALRAECETLKSGFTYCTRDSSNSGTKY